MGAALAQHTCVWNQLARAGPRPPARSIRNGEDIAEMWRDLARTCDFEREALLGNAWGGQVICDDRSLVVEEAAAAYKDAGQVVRDLADAGLVRTLASMKPLVTYKKAIDGPVDRTRNRSARDRT